MAQELRKLREDMAGLKEDAARQQNLLEQKARLNYDSIWKSIRDLEDGIERLKRWQLSINEIFTCQEHKEQKEQQVLYHPTKRSAMRRRKP
jgi:hypothetical protein